MPHDEPAGRVAARPGVTSPSSGSWSRWPPPAAASSSHDQFFSVIKKARPAPPLSGMSLLNKPRPLSASSSMSGSKLKPGGSSKAPVSLLKAAPLRMGGVAVSAACVAKTGLPRPGPSSAAAPSSKISVSRPGPPAGTGPKVRHPSAGARPRVPSGGTPRPSPDPFRPKPSASAPKPRMSWDLDLLTDGSPQDNGNFATDLEQSPSFLKDNFDQRRSVTPALLLDRDRPVGPMPHKARAMFPKSKRGRPPKAPGEQRVPRKYVKKKQAANGSSGHGESVPILHGKPKWKGAAETLRNDLKLKEKRRRRKEQLVAVRMDGSVPQVVTLLPKDPADPTGPVPVVSPNRDGPRPVITSPLRRLSGGSAGERSHDKPETKPLFEHIDEDWAVIKKSLEKTETKERKLSEASSSEKTSSVAVTPSPTKKSDRSDELSSDDDVGNDLNAPLHNLEKLQDQMIKNLMDDGALAALKEKRRRQKEVKMFKKKKMSDYWKSKLGPGKLTLEMKLKRPYTMRPLTSDNVKHMEEAIAAVLAAPSPESSPEKRPPPAYGIGSPPKSGPSADRAPDRVPPLLIRRLPGPQRPPPHPPLPPPTVSEPVSKPITPPASRLSPQSAPRIAVARPPPPQSVVLQPPTPAAAVGLPKAPVSVPAAVDGLERRSSTEPESDPAAAARLLRVKQELAARFLSDLHEQRAQLQAAEQQRQAWQQQQQERTAAAAQQQQQLWRPLIRIRHRRRRGGQPRIVRLTQTSIQAGSQVTDADIGDDGEDDGLAPMPVLDSPPPVSVSANRVKEFLDTARVSRHRRTCVPGRLVSVRMPEETSDRMVFVSQRPLPPEAERTLVSTGQGFDPPAIPGALWPSEPIVPALTPAAWPAGPPLSGNGWYGPPMPPVGATTGWSGGGVSQAAPAGWYGAALSPAPATVGQGQSIEEITPDKPLAASSSTAPTAAQAATATNVMALAPTPAAATSVPSSVPSPVPTLVPSALPAAVRTVTPEKDASDTSMEEQPLQIVLPATPTTEQTATPVASTPRTPLSLSPRVSPSAAPLAPQTVTLVDPAGRPPPGSTPTVGTPAPGTPSGVSPRAASGVSADAPPSLPPVDPDSLPFACNQCPTRLATLSEQVYHEIRMHMTENQLFRCLGCPMLVPLNGDPSLVLNGLLDHYMRHVDGAGRLLPFDTSGDFFRCEFCPRVFEDPTAYGTHEVQCRSLKHTCVTCHGRFETGDLLKWHEVDHLRAPDGKYCCDHCDSKFTKREQLLGHRRFHFKDKNVECPKCGKKFMTTGMLAMHNKWKHSQGPCRFCGRPFTSATARQAHEEHMHLKHMMHMCDVCHFRVMTATQLRVHKRTHSDNKPHRCSTCDETFVSRNLLKKHKIARHSEPRPAAAEDGGAAPPEPTPAPVEPLTPQSAGESARAADGTLTPAELRQLFDRYKATWNGPRNDMTLSDLDTDEDEDEKRDLLDNRAKEQLFKTKDKNSLSVWSCPLCHAFFTKLWGVRAHITLKHPGTSVGPILHDDKGTNAVSKQAFLKEIKRNAKTAKRELKLEAKRQARIAAYGDELPRRGRPRKYPDRPPVIRKPVDPSQPRKRGRPRKNPDDPTAPPQPVAEAPPAPPPPPKPDPKPEPPPDHVERRRWKCLTCEDQSQSYDDLVTHTYIAHPDADLPRFEVVITYVPKPVPKTPAKPSTPPPEPDAAPEPEEQQDRDAAILDAARVRGAEKRRAPSATKVPAGAKRRSIPSATEGATRGRGRGRGATGGGGRGSGSGGGGGRGRASGGDSYRKSYSNSSRRYKAEDSVEPAAAATDDADKLYCYCQSPYDEVSEMIGCDSDHCKHEWFHFECVGIVIAPKGKWFCPDCSDKKSNK